MEREAAQKRIAELSETIDRYNYEYYMNDNSMISDYDFDQLLNELIALEKEYPDLNRKERENNNAGKIV